MSTRYPGGFINRSAPVIVGPVDGEGGSAPGVWTLEQASYYTKQGTWPLPTKQRPLFSWGLNNNGQLGQNDRVSRSSPVQVGSGTVWSSLGGTITKAVFATTTAGTLWSWGNGSQGQLGQNDSVNRSSPTQIGALTTWLTVSSNANYFCSSTKTDQTIWVWGSNGYGQLGQNNIIYRSSPVQLGSLNDWQLVSSGSYHVIALKTGATLWSWGSNVHGQLGQNDRVNRSSPVQVGLQTTWQKISCGALHSLAIKTDGSLWAWGFNTYGQLGQNDIVARSSPVQVGALTNWSYISGGEYSSCALKADGSLWAFGANNYGNLGDNSTILRSSPVQIGTLYNWSKVFAAPYNTYAIKTDGSLWAWGYNAYGQLGQNDRVYRSSPVQVGNLTTWLTASFCDQTVVATQKV